MQRVKGGLLGALTGLGFTTMGLIHTGNGFDVTGGNEATPTVIVGGLVVGGFVGATILARRQLVMLGAILGLAFGIWLRDNLTSSPVQPPWVFLLLFGLPAVGAATGYFLHRSNERQSESAA
jgi:hypothetical protein